MDGEKSKIYGIRELA